MKLIHTHSLYILWAILIGISVLLSPSFAVTAQTHSSVYQEVITKSNTGGQTSSSANITTDSASVEVTNTTVIDGKRYEYYFSTTTPESVEHQVVIQNDVPLFSDTKTNELQTNDTIEYLKVDQARQAWIISMMKIIQTLQLYVAQSF